jgi:hypothetical protein
MPLAPEAGHAPEGGAASLVAQGVDRLMRAVEGVVTVMNPSVDLEPKEQGGVDP